jgi:hypothetical protein
MNGSLFKPANNGQNKPISNGQNKPAGNGQNKPANNGTVKNKPASNGKNKAVNNGTGNNNSKHWVKHTKNKNVWYINKKDPISVWEMPEGGILNNIPLELYKLAEGGDWIKVLDNNNHIWYYNKKTNISDWDKPKNIVFKNLPEKKPFTANIEEPVPELSRVNEERQRAQAENPPVL